VTRLKKIFETRTAGIICFLFAITNRIIFSSFYSLVGTDTKVQLTYAQNLLAGKGMGVTKYFTSDLNAPIYDTHLMFPPGFSLTIIPFLKLFDNDEFKAVHAFDMLTSIFFVWTVWRLAKKVGLPAALNNIVVLIAGCTQYLFFMSWSSTDAISICFLLFALTETIEVIHKGEETSLLRIIGCGLLVCLPYFFRYMYLPVAGLLPLFVLLSGFNLKNKNLKVAGLKLLGVSVFFIAVLSVISLLTYGNALYLNNFGRGFYVNQLTDWYPFLPASFINLDFAAQLIEKFSQLNYSQAMLYFNIINILLMILLSFLFGRYIYFHKRDLFSSRYSAFITIGSFISIFTILLLAYLSFTYKEIEWGYISWTYISDERYFAFVYIFMPLLFFICLYYYKAFFKRPLTRFIVFIAMCSFIIEVTHGIYYNIKILRHHKDLTAIRESENVYKRFPAIIKEIKEQNPDREVFVTSPDLFYTHDASQLGYKAIFDYQNLSKTDLAVTKKSILILPIHTNEVIIMKDYIEKKKPKSVLTIEGVFFYAEEINPE